MGRFLDRQAVSQGSQAGLSLTYVWLCKHFVLLLSFEGKKLKQLRIHIIVSRELVGICISTDDLEDRETSLARFASDMINYCKETTIVRILPVMAVVYELYKENIDKK